LPLVRCAGKRRTEPVVVGERGSERVQLLLHRCSGAPKVGLDVSPYSLELPLVLPAQCRRDFVSEAECQKRERHEHDQRTPEQQPNARAMHSLRFVSTAGAAIPREVHDRMQSALGVPVLEHYGSSETAQIASNRPPPGPARSQRR